MKLYLLRHGIAVPHGSSEYPEDQRPLTPQGERRTRQVAYGLKSMKLGLDRIVTSPLPRAFRTAEITARVLGSPDLLETAEELAAGQSAEQVARWLTTRGEANLMIVGHNPTFSDLIGLLTTGRLDPPVCELKRAGIAALSTAVEGGRMTIDWIARPRLIRRLSDR